MPPWLLALLLGSLTLALLYQLVTRRFGWRVVGYWLVIFAGVTGAEILAELASWNVTRVGDLRVLPDSFGAVLVVAMLWFLRI